MPGFGPLGGVPLATLPATGWELFSHAVFTDRTTLAQWLFAFSDSAVFGSALTPKDLPNLYGSAIATGSATPYLTLRNNVVAGAQFQSAVNVAWKLVLTASGILDAPVVPHLLPLGAMADTLVLSGAVSTHLQAIGALSAALALESLLSNGWGVHAVGSAAFSAALAQTLHALTPLVSAAVMAGTTSDALRITMLASSTGVAHATLANAMTLQAGAVDGMVLYATLRLGSVDYAGWVMNTDNKAASQYTNFAFDSLATFRNRVFAAGNGGVFELTGNTDAGAPIPASIRTGMTDFGTGKIKQVPEIYIGRKGDGRIVAKVITTSITGTKVEDWYVTAPDVRGSDLREGLITVGRGLESRYWQFILCNQAGGALDLSDVALRPISLSRRV